MTRVTELIFNNKWNDATINNMKPKRIEQYYTDSTKSAEINLG